MLSISAAVKLWYCPDAVDMRLGFDGLFALVQNRLHGDPLSGHLLK
jgi:transposase